MKFYVIQDKATGELWASQRGRRVWARPAFAKSAWNADYGDPLFNPDVMFKRQDRYVCREATVTPVGDPL